MLAVERRNHLSCVEIGKRYERHFGKAEGVFDAWRHRRSFGLKDAAAYDRCHLDLGLHTAGRTISLRNQRRSTSSR